MKIVVGGAETCKKIISDVLIWKVFIKLQFNNKIDVIA